MRTNGKKRSLVLRMVLAVTTMAMIVYRRVGSRSCNSSFGRSVATALVTRTNKRTNKNANVFVKSNSNNNDRNIVPPFTTRDIRLLNSRGDGYDDAGRRVRTPRPTTDDWGDSDDWGEASSSDRRSGNQDNRSSSRSGGSDNSWDDFDPWEAPRQQRQPQPQRRRNNDNSIYDVNDDDDGGTPRNRSANQSAGRQRYDGGFDDDDGWGATSDRPRRVQSGGGRSGGRGRGRGGGRGRGRGRDRDWGGRSFQQDSRGRGRDRDRGGRSFQQDSRGGRNKEGDNPSASLRTINMNALEVAGFVHLYGISSVLNALVTGRRDMETSMEKSDEISSSRFKEFDKQDDWEIDDDDDFGASRSSPPSRKENVKAQAQFKPYLFVQERSSSGSDRRGSKASAAQEVLKLAEERGVPIAQVDKGILNVLSGNRPHQGFALRCGKMYFDSLSRIPLPTNARGGDSTPSSPALWLVLDEVVDPQNLGALLRSAYFLGGKKNKNHNIGVLVCSKNSAPPSPVVSASSAGALEVLDVQSTSNLPRTLNQARVDGFRIIGASSSVLSVNAGGAEDHDSPPLYDLQDLPIRNSDGDDRPILLVLGSEGHGLRTLVAKACTEFVSIPAGMGGLEPMDDDSTSEAGVDSLNVSVSAGIMMWHLLHGSGGN